MYPENGLLFAITMTELSDLANPPTGKPRQVGAGFFLFVMEKPARGRLSNNLHYAFSKNKVNS